MPTRPRGFAPASRPEPIARPDPSSIRDRAGPIVALGVAMVSLQVGAAVAQHLFPLAGAIGAATLRLVIAAAVLLGATRPWRQAALFRARWRPLLLYGASLGGMNCLFYLALRTVPLGLVVAIEFMGPLGVACLHARRRLDWMWILLAAGGLVFLLPLRGSAHAIDPVGALLALGAGAWWAVYILAGKASGDGHAPGATAIGMVVGAVLVLPFGIVEAGARLLAPDALALGAVVALLSSAVPYTLEMMALTRLAPQTYGTLTSVEPVLGALAGLAILGQRLAPSQWLAIVAIVAASLGTALTIAPVPRQE